jgi:hypothetical protein
MLWNAVCFVLLGLETQKAPWQATSGKLFPKHRGCISDDRIAERKADEVVGRGPGGPPYPLHLVRLTLLHDGHSIRPILRRSWMLSSPPWHTAKVVNPPFAEKTCPV